MPLADHAEIGRGSRPDPVELLESQAATRIPQLVPIRYGRMLATPFTFFRGAALIMAADLGSTPHSGLMVQLCGDAHLSNFGFYATPERNQAFDINDFDETYPGPFEWDVKRLAASVAVAGLVGGFSPKKGPRGGAGRGHRVPGGDPPARADGQSRGLVLPRGHGRACSGRPASGSAPAPSRA